MYAEISKYCNYEDLKELYKKVLPPIFTFQKQIQEFADEVEQVKRIQLEIDDKLAQKVNKIYFDQLSNHVDQAFALKTQL